MAFYLNSTILKNVQNFRDQNFGINDLAAIQDVRNEFSLQDIDGTSESSLTGAPSSGTFKEKGKNFVFHTQKPT